MNSVAMDVGIGEEAAFGIVFSVEGAENAFLVILNTRCWSLTGIISVRFARTAVFLGDA